MVFVCINVEIIHHFFIFRLFLIFGKLQTMNFIFYGLLTYLRCQTYFFTTTSIRCLYRLLQQSCLCILCEPFVWIYSKNTIKKIFTFPSFFVGKQCFAKYYVSKRCVSCLLLCASTTQCFSRIGLFCNIISIDSKDSFIISSPSLCSSSMSP